jgi:hypothetical protein
MMFWERGTHACLAADNRYLSAQGWNQKKPESDDPLIQSSRRRKSTDHRSKTRSNTNNSWARATVQAHGPREPRRRPTVSVSIRFRPSSDVDTLGPPADQAFDCPPRQGSHVATDRVAPPSHRKGHVRCGAFRRHTPAP